jgi:hypothetical protein
MRQHAFPLYEAARVLTHGGSANQRAHCADLRPDRGVVALPNQYRSLVMEPLEK